MKFYRPQVFLLSLILFFFLSTVVFGQIGTNPGDPNTNNAFPSNQPKRFKQDSGTVKKAFTSKSVRQITEQDLSADSLTLHPIDTSVVGVERYSPLYPYDRFQLNLGNLGLAARPLLPEFSSPTGFHNGQTVLSLYLLSPENIRYYRNKSPYTELAFLTGGKKEQWFSLLHAQNLNPRLSIGLQYYRVGSKGYYPRQKTDVLNLAFFTWYQSRNYRYNLVSSIVFNSLNAAENGGAVNTTLFTANSTVSHDFESVYLQSAQTSWDQFDYYLKQWYSVGHLDSIKEKTFKSVNIYPTLQATYTLHYSLHKYRFDDALPDLVRYYPNTFLDTAVTADGIRQRTVENEFGLALFGHGNLKREGHFSASGIHLNASLKDILVRYQQNGVIDSNFNNLLIHSKASYNLSDQFRLTLTGDYNLIGPNRGDYYLEASGLVNLGRSVGTLRGLAAVQVNEPDLIFNRNVSNAYRWDYHFNKVKTERLMGSYENTLLKVKASVELNLVDGYTYFAGSANQLVFPTQFQNQIRLFRVKLEKEFVYHHIGLQTYVVYQKNNQPLIVRTPEAYAFASLFYQSTLFKVLRTRIGLDATFFSQTYLYDYAPGLQQFFVFSSGQTGNLPIVNFFIVAGLKRVNITLKYDYVNQGFPTKGYYMINNYPAADKVIKFGVSWKFYD